MSNFLGGFLIQVAGDTEMRKRCQNVSSHGHDISILCLYQSFISENNHSRAVWCSSGRALGDPHFNYSESPINYHPSVMVRIRHTDTDTHHSQNSHSLHYQLTGSDQ